MLPAWIAQRASEAASDESYLHGINAETSIFTGEFSLIAELLLMRLPFVGIDSSVCASFVDLNKDACQMNDRNVTDSSGPQESGF
ncbi:MAG: hypothetical protein ACI93T_000200 [Porticoccaceae bacterium]|jgi:hypothetical protein